MIAIRYYCLDSLRYGASFFFLFSSVISDDPKNAPSQENLLQRQSCEEKFYSDASPSEDGAIKIPASEVKVSATIVYPTTTQQNRPHNGCNNALCTDPLSQRPLLPLLQKMKEAYLLWYDYYRILPKPHRHSLGIKIDTYMIESIEFVATASFLPRSEKLPFVRAAMRKVDTLKLLLMMLWETKSLDDKKYIALSVKIDAIGKMLGGWNGQLEKQNPPKTMGGK